MKTYVIAFSLRGTGCNQDGKKYVADTELTENFEAACFLAACNQLKSRYPNAYNVFSKNL